MPGRSRPCRADLAAALALGLFLAAFFAPGLLQGKLLLSEDLPQFLAFRSDLYRLGHGEPFTLWNELPGLGAPRLANMQVGYLSPLALPFYVFPTLPLFAVHPPLLLLLLGLSTYAFLRTVGLSPLPAAFGALSWLRLGIVLDHVQHPNAVETMCWLPLFLLAWTRFRDSGRGPWAAAALLAGGGMMVAGHPQYLLYGVLLAAGWVLTDVARRRSRRLLAAALAIALGAALLGLPQILPAADLAARSQRAFLPAATLSEQFRATPAEVGLALVGERHALGEWPRMESGGYPMAPGVSLLTLAFAAWAVSRRRAFAGPALAAALFLVGMLGTAGPVGWAMQHLPLAGSMRAPVRMLVPAAFLLAWMAAWGMQLWMGSDRRRAWGAAAACAWLLALWWGLHHPRTRFVEASALEPNAGVRGLSQGRLALDFLTVPPLQANSGLLAGARQLAVYDPLVPRNLFVALFASQLGPLSDEGRVALAASIGNTIPVVRPDLPLMRAFDLRRVVGWREGLPQVQDLGSGPGRFFLAREILEAGSDPELWALAASATWDPGSQVLAREPLASRSSGPGRVEVREDRPDRQVLDVSGGGGILVTSGLFDPGWRVSVDGVPTRAREVDVALRAVEVPAGEHRVEWDYRPRWRLPALLGPLAGLLLAGALALQRGGALALRGRSQPSS